MSLHVLGPVLIDGNLNRAVLELLKQVPLGADSVTVVIPMDGFFSVKDATIFGLHIQFAPTFWTPELVGTVRIEYDFLVNPESFRIPPAGVIGL